MSEFVQSMVRSNNNIFMNLYYFYGAHRSEIGLQMQRTYRIMLSKCQHAPLTSLNIIMAVWSLMENKFQKKISNSFFLCFLPLKRDASWAVSQFRTCCEGSEVWAATCSDLNQQQVSVWTKLTKQNLHIITNIVYIAWRRVRWFFLASEKPERQTHVPWSIASVRYRGTVSFVSPKTNLFLKAYKAWWYEVENELKHRCKSSRCFIMFDD